MRGPFWPGWALMLLATSLAATQETAPPSPDEGDSGKQTGVVATVNGDPVYLEDVIRQLNATHSGLAETERSAFDLDRLMDRMVDDALLAQEARTSGMHEEEPTLGRVRTFRANLAFERLEDEEIWSKVEITDEELRRVFDRDYATVTLRTLTAYERHEADDLWAQVSDGADFDALARERSVDQYAARGGLAENLPRIDLAPAIAAAAWSLEPGQLTGPVSTTLGWTIIRVEAFGEPDPEGFEQRKAGIRETVRYRKAELLRRQLGKQLRQSTAVTVEKDTVDAIGCERLPDGRLVPEIEDPATTVARIGKRSISAGELGRALQSRWKGVRNEQAALAAKPPVLERLIRTELMQSEALRRGYGDTLEAQRAIRAYETTLLVRRYVNEVVTPKVQVTDEEIESYYQENRDDYRKPPRVHLGQITVADQEEAERLAELLRQGSDLAWLARQHSIDRFKDAGGDRGWVVPAHNVDAFQDAFFEAQPGTVLGPVGVPGNFIVIQVDAREEQGHYSLEEASSRIRSTLFGARFREYIEDYLDRLRSRSEIEIDRKVLASMQISSERIEEDTQAPPAAHGRH